MFIKVSEHILKKYKKLNLFLHKYKNTCDYLINHISLIMNCEVGVAKYTSVQDEFILKWTLIHNGSTL